MVTKMAAQIAKKDEELRQLKEMLHNLQIGESGGRSSVVDKLDH